MVELIVYHLKLLDKVVSSRVFLKFNMFGRAHAVERLLEVLPCFHLVVGITNHNQVGKRHLVDQARNVPQGNEGGLLPLGDLSLIKTLELCSCRDDGDELANDLVDLRKKD